MSNIPLDYERLISSGVQLFESTLATYEKLASEKRLKKGELDRLEAMIESYLVVSHDQLKAFVLKARHFMYPPKIGRIDTLLRYIELGENATEAARRFFLVHRHRRPDAHRE